MRTLFMMLDVNYGIQIMRRSLRGVTGDGAKTYVVSYSVLAFILFAALWRYDIGATYDYTEGWGRALAESLPSWLSFGGYTVPIILAALGVSSVVIQFTFPRIAAHVAIRWLLIGSIVFDLVTDLPRVAVDVDAFLMPMLLDFITLPDPFLTLAVWAVRFICTIVASLVLQSVLFILLIGIKDLLGQMGSERRGRARHAEFVEGEVV